MSDVKRSHRTALIVDATSDTTPQFKERVNRLVQSLNGRNIKVDVFTLGSTTTTSVRLVPGVQFASESKSDDYSLDDARQEVGELGYIMRLEAHPA